jgi:hypothetical membrane protein
MAIGHKDPPLATIGGMLVVVLFCFFTLASAVRYPGAFSPLDNWLSDLGTMKKNPAGYVYFNVGCILTGASIMLMAWGMDIWRVEKNTTFFMAARIIGVTSALALMLIGAFDENTPYHSLLSIAFFLLLALFLIFTNVPLWKHPAYMKWIGYYALIVIVVDLVLAVTFVVLEHAPIWEWLAVFGALAWVGLLAYNMYRLDT